MIEILLKNLVKNLTNKIGNFKTSQTREIDTPPIREILLRPPILRTKKSAFADLVDLTSLLSGWPDNLACTVTQIIKRVNWVWTRRELNPVSLGYQASLANLPSPHQNHCIKPATDSFKCPYCLSPNFVRRGTRQKKLETVQLYLCKDCGKTFTPHLTKGKHYPLPIILDALAIYNLGYSLEQTCQIVNRRASNLNQQKTTLSDGSLASYKPNVVALDLSSKKSISSLKSVSQIALQASTLANWLTEFKDKMLNRI